MDAVKDNNLNRDSLSNLHVADLLLSSFQETEAQQVISSLLSSASTKETIASLFGKFPAAASQNQCKGSEICYCAYTALQNKVLRNLFEMYFATTFSQNGNNRDISIIKSFVGRVPLTLETCYFVDAEPRDFRSSLSLRDRQEFSSAQLPNRDWRSQITDTFVQTSEMAHSSMLKKIEDICFDMERRCYDVEGPLRSVENDRNRHVLEVEQLQRQNEELQQNNRQSTHTISDLRQEIARLEEHAESACNRIGELSVSLNSAQQELHDQRRLSEETLHAEKDNSRTRELDLIAASTEKDDQLEELQEELRRVRSENDRFRQSLDAETQEKASSLETIAFLQRDLEEYERGLEHHQALCSEKEDKVRSLLAENEDLRMETENMKTMVNLLYSSW